jgi:hypothetical protein
VACLGAVFFAAATCRGGAGSAFVFAILTASATGRSALDGAAGSEAEIVATAVTSAGVSSRRQKPARAISAPSPPSSSAMKAAKPFRPADRIVFAFASIWVPNRLASVARLSTENRASWA